jgi:anti-anti-sigma factor
MTGDGGAKAVGTDRVVDLSQELYIATEQKNYKTWPEAEGPGRPKSCASSGSSRHLSSRFGAAEVKGLYAKSSTWMPDGSVDYNYASARVMCSTDGMALVRVTGEIDHCTAPKLSGAVNEALSEGACSIFIDLAEVTFFSAAGAIVLLGARRHCQRRGAELMLLRPSRPAQRVLAFTDLLKPMIDLSDRSRPGNGHAFGDRT